MEPKSKRYAACTDTRLLKIKLAQLLDDENWKYFNITTSERADEITAIGLRLTELGVDLEKAVPTMKAFEIKYPAS